MRVIAGSAKGRRLKTVASRKVRPTADRVKEAVFSMISSRVELAGVGVLDLFAGSGALGIEALSRGAKRATFVERDRQTCRVLLDNITACGFKGQSEVLTRSVSGAIGELAERSSVFDLILIDPPYADGVLGDVLAELDRAGIAAPGSVVVAEHGGDEEVEDVGDFRLTRTRRYGSTSVTLLTSEPQSESDDLS